VGGTPKPYAPLGTHSPSIVVPPMGDEGKATRPA
jgi:hypothetical protein